MNPFMAYTVKGLEEFEAGMQRKLQEIAALPTGTPEVEEAKRNYRESVLVQIEQARTARASKEVAA